MTEFDVALDAMGGDHAPEVPVDSAIDAANAHGISILLVGNESELRSRLTNRDYPEDLIDIVDAPEVVAMEDDAVSAVRRKQRASIPVGLELLKTGVTGAFLSAGHTGAVVASAVVSLGRLPNVHRPGIAIPIPTLSGDACLLIDAGALVDARPEHLWQHARLATCYAEHVNGVPRPRVGLISNGEEPGKGNALAKQAHELLRNDPGLRFVGNIEARSIASNICDVIVTDGFTGNAILKTGEGIVNLLQFKLREELTSRWTTSVLAALLRPAFRRAAKSLDYREYGGAPLLGVEGLVYIAHGSSDRRALASAILTAKQAVASSALERLRLSLADGGRKEV